MKFAYPPIFQIFFCRNWHLEPALSCFRLPRFQRAGPSTSLDRSALGRVYVEILSHSNMIVNFLKLDYSGSNSGFNQEVLFFSSGPAPQIFVRKGFLRAGGCVRNAPSLLVRWQLLHSITLPIFYCDSWLFVLVSVKRCQQHPTERWVW